jgi:hypothetical protein
MDKQSIVDCQEFIFANENYNELYFVSLLSFLFLNLNASISSEVPTYTPEEQKKRLLFLSVHSLCKRLGGVIW